jgi:uncharacterized protein GlcG (DUF336 family)
LLTPVVDRQELQAQEGRGGPADVLTSQDVSAIITVAAESLDGDTMAVAVVDRTGRILGVYTRPDAGPTTPDIAVTLARTGAFFTNDQAPLSSRTVRYISGIHYPPGVPNTANAALYGIENTNRGCRVDELIGVVEAPRSIAGAGKSGRFGTTELPCGPEDASGCAVGGPIVTPTGRQLDSVGITTGKASLLDTGEPLNVPVNPGGIPILRNGQVIGGVGVAGVQSDRAEFAAVRAAALAGRGLGFREEDLPPPEAVFLEGIRLPFFEGCNTSDVLDCIVAALGSRPPGSASGQLGDGVLRSFGGGVQAPEGYLVGPREGADGKLTREDVERIVSQGVASALRTRAQIRLPPGQATSMIIGVSDTQGNILAAFRMADATWFSLDVAITKARNAYYFSTREGYEVLRSLVDNNPYDSYSWEPEPPAGQGWAITNRTLSFGGQPLFPPGIDLEKLPTPGPWFDLFVYDSQNPCTEGPGPGRGGNRQYDNQSGIVWFPGSLPLYRNGELVGGLGVSGDGVEQDDLVSAEAAVGFEPPDELRVDQSFIRVGSGEEVRLPYLRYPRNPIQR